MDRVDVHVHPPTREFLIDAGGHFAVSAMRFFKREIEIQTVEEMVAEYDEAKVDKIVLLGWDAETQGLPKVSNDYIASVVDSFPKKIIGFASVDPNKGDSAVKELERSIRDLKLGGLKLHPQAQRFRPNSATFYPLYEKCLELGIPIMFHSGTTAWGAGLPGGGGVILEVSNPMLVDEVAARFPELKIILAHPAWPWLDEQLATVAHKSNVYMDLSGWSPKYFQPILVDYMARIITDKCLFGTDYPFLTPRKWLNDFDKLQIPDDVKEKILGKNARKLLKI